MTKRPNILYFMTDQHRADWLGCAGHPVVRTPNIDGLAARGTRFTNFHVTTPVCMPNRGAIFTGRYPSVNGLRHNGLPLPINAKTFVDILRDAGYRTASIGKSHLQPINPMYYVRADEEYIANENIPEATEPDGNSYDYELPSTFDGEDEAKLPEPYYGFDYIKMVTNHSDHCGGHYLQHLRRERDDWRDLRDRSTQLDHNFSNPQAFKTRIPENLYPTFYIRDEAKRYLEEQAKNEDPFFAFVSFPDPHHPFTPPGKYWEMYDPDDFAVDLRYQDHMNPPPQLKKWKELMDEGIIPKNMQQAFMAPDQQIKEAMALTAGMITMIDDAIGSILETLEKTGQLENTIIIFNSDHGDYMGAFNLLLKGPFAHETVNRVPFIWVDPEGRKAELAKGLAASVDIAATILDRVNLKPYYGIQGKSFLPMIEGKPSCRDYVLIEHEENKVYPGLKDRPNMRNLMTETHRITIYKGLEFGELYNLQTDPMACQNLWEEPDAAPIKAEMMHLLSQAMLDAIEPGPWPTRIA